MDEFMEKLRQRGMNMSLNGGLPLHLFTFGKMEKT